MAYITNEILSSRPRVSKDSHAKTTVLKTVGSDIHHRYGSPTQVLSIGPYSVIHAVVAQICMTAHRAFSV